ncbi:hypothetical protein GTP46_12890 [Duganella sp. FT135W]|uniref:Uncharacterized protein n=1 Tax=Duganella flavida TaxID=2692175 RepID=A0A6L8KCR9_9BURK|nr:hypothetical protein [Duganella flavida]MYM23544.1 hypothetical protein [Duganella flavida]
MKMLAAALIAAVMPAWAAEPPLVVHYNERPPYHYTERGVPAGDAVAKVAGALKAAHIPYLLRSTPAKQQLVLLQKNESPACMLAWVDLPGRDGKGKLSEKIYEERRLWCTKATPDETMQRIDAALRKAALPK